jgi:hypothetical protein
VFRDEFFDVEIVVFEDLLVVGSRCELSKTNGCTFGQYAPLSQKILVICLYLIVLFAHAGHPKCSLMYEILKHFNVLFELLQF